MDKTFTQKKIDTALPSKKNERLYNLTEIPTTPSKQVVDRILNYSKSLCVKQSVVIKQVEFVLN